ncbi:hypothetical protein TNCV_1416771 [Trichonephila clavipes]|nr:hypothetical protein TNCV_1416771 [Trichonephila clavipes]
MIEMARRLGNWSRLEVQAMIKFLPAENEQTTCSEMVSLFSTRQTGCRKPHQHLILEVHSSGGNLKPVTYLVITSEKKTEMAAETQPPRSCGLEYSYTFLLLEKSYVRQSEIQRLSVFAESAKYHFLSSADGGCSLCFTFSWQKSRTRDFVTSSRSCELGIAGVTAAIKLVAVGESFDSEHLFLPWKQVTDKKVA